MRSAVLLVTVAMLAAACQPNAVAGGEQRTVVVVPAAEEPAAVEASQGPAETGDDSSRDWLGEQERFHELVASGSGGPDEVLAALGVSPDFRFRYTTVDGTSMTGMEFRAKGRRPGSPFFEAFADDHPGASYYVFFERHWFQWRAVECGFHEAGLISPQFADGR